jgi:hypothetical protein
MSRSPGERRQVWVLLGAFLALQAGWSYPVGPFAQNIDTAEQELDRAIYLAVSGEYLEARKLFLTIRADRTQDALLNYYVGVSSFFLGDLASARLHLECSVEDGASFPEAFYWLAETYLTEESRELARKIVSEGLECFPQHVGLQRLSRHLESR